MAEDGGILSEEMKAAAVLVINQAQDALMIWAARDPNPDAGGTHPTYALAEVEGEALASALVLSAASLAAGDEPVSFNKHVAPILFKHCATCHRPDNNHTIDPVYISKLPKNDPLFAGMW